MNQRQTAGVLQDQAIGLGDKLSVWVNFVKSHGSDEVIDLGRGLIEQDQQKNEALAEARAAMEQLEALIKRLTAPPYTCGTYMRQVETPYGPRCLIDAGSSMRIIEHNPESVDVDSLRQGDLVLLAGDLVISKAVGFRAIGQSAIFDRVIGEGRMVLEHGGQKHVVDSTAIPAVLLEKAKAGDNFVYNPKSGVATEYLGNDKGSADQYLMPEVTDIGREHIGGQDVNLQRVLDALTVVLTDRKVAERYHVASKHPTVMLIGPPGTGKTLMARISAAEIARTSGSKCRFAVVKPGEWKDPFVGVTERKIRDTFAMLKESAKDGFAVLFLDEIESIGRTRGVASNVHSDSSLGSLLAEINGFSCKGNIAIMAATNRKDLVDPALLERLSEIEVVVDRPTEEAAKDIFGIHLPQDLPYSPNGSMAAQKQSRQAIIGRAVNLFYQNGGGGRICQMYLNSGRPRTVLARELASGRCFEQICADAKRSAFLRDVRDKDRKRRKKKQGIRVEDVEQAVERALDKLATMLTPDSAHTYLHDLRRDEVVVQVVPLRGPRAVVRAQKEAVSGMGMDNSNAGR